MAIKLESYAAENLGMYYTHKMTLNGVTFYVCEKGVIDHQYHAAIDVDGKASYSACGRTLKSAVRHCLELHKIWIMKALEA